MLDKKTVDLLLSKYYLRFSQSSRKDFKEVTLSKELAIALRMQYEVKAPLGCGRMDCINKDMLIECKKISTHGCKSAIGQLLIYDYSQSHKRKLALGLIGEFRDIPRWVQSYCSKLSIAVFLFVPRTGKWVLWQWN